MTLTVLGSGTYIPTKNRAPSGYWLEVGELNILIDCGSGILQRIIQAGKDFFDIDIIIISHLHPDHTAGLPALFQISYKHYTKSRIKQLYIFGGRGYKKWHQGVAPYFSGWPQEGKKDKLTIYQFPQVRQKTVKGVKFTLAQGNHEASSIVVRIEYKNKTLVYTGDTGFDVKLVRFCKDVDVLLTECNSPEGVEVPGHLRPSLCGQLASQAGVKKLVLTHLSPMVLKSPIQRIVKQYYQDPIILAKDLIKIKI